MSDPVVSVAWEKGGGKLGPICEQPTQTPQKPEALILRSTTQRWHGLALIPLAGLLRASQVHGG